MIKTSPQLKARPKFLFLLFHVVCKMTHASSHARTATPIFPDSGPEGLYQLGSSAVSF